MDNEIKQILSKLTDEEKELLMSEHIKNGEILRVDIPFRRMTGFDRDISVLINNALIHDIENKGEIFSLTGLGWKVFDELKTK